jgi:hypothetical protein
MNRCCVIGDSHVSSLLEAKPGKSVAATHEITFFTAPGECFANLRLRDGRFISDESELSFQLQSHSGDKEEIVIADYDEFIVMGLDFFSGILVSYYDEFVFDEVYDKLGGPGGDKYLLSDACFSAICEGALSRTEAMRVAIEIRSVTDRPVTVVAAPNPGAGISEGEFPEEYPHFHALVRDGVDEVYAKFFNDVCERLAAKHRVQILAPLREAAENGVFNRREYSVLSQLKPGASANERVNAAAHGNARYGRLLIDRLLRSRG